MDFKSTEYIAFESFTTLHFTPIFVLSLLCVVAIQYAKYKGEKIQNTIGLLLSLTVLIAMLFRSFMVYLEGNFSIQEELPLHLCRLMALVMPFLMWYRVKNLLNIAYFLIIAGTLQAVLTPDLNEGPPHYGYYVYFIMHVILVWLPIYTVKVYKIIPSFKDLIKAIIFANIYMVFTFILNKSIGSNYFYTNFKPPNGSVLDYLGDWPWYIINAELIGIVFFLIAYLPFRNIKT